MRKLSGWLIVLVLILCAAAAAGEGIPTAQVIGSIEDGAYVLTVKLDPDDAGDWQADEMAQDASVVKLTSSGTENGVFTARYEPVSDGAVSVYLRHFNEHTCDRMLGFDLIVKDGKVQEATGGSETGSPSEEDQDPYFSGEWLEKDTQFIMLDVTKNIGNGWQIEMMSPVSHGSWIIRATVYYDCDYDAFVYADGVKYDILPDDDTPAKETEKDLWGTIRFAGTEDNLQLVWYGMEASGNEEIAFERAPGLPTYRYTGEDPIEGAVADALANDERAGLYKTEQGYVTIPCPIIHRTEMIDDTHARVYGTFWILNYVKRGLVLINISGGEYAGIMMVEMADGIWRVTSFEEAGDGDDYAADIEHFAAGDKELEAAYFAAADLGAETNQEIRTRFIQEYVATNSLPVIAYQDYGWDPVSLE